MKYSVIFNIFSLKSLLKYKLFFLLAILGVFSSNIAFSQTNVEAIFGEHTLNENFSPNPYILDGVSGGNTQGNTITNRESTFTGSCNGYMQSQPDYEIILNESFEQLSMEVISEVDTTLIVQGVDGGVWCNDDYGESTQPQNPRLDGSWNAGNYRVWVGSYSQNSYHPYQLRISR